MARVDEYNFGDFTRSNYRRLLQLAKDKYDFSKYTDLDEKGRFILWRHDVDISVHSAYKLALIEYEEGVKSTYFLHPHSEFYNLLEKEITDLVHKIISLGHDIGLHFDVYYHKISRESELEARLAWEKELLSIAFQQDVNVFSFHNTTPFTMNCKELEYAGMINVYSDYFQKNVFYCSDSNGHWQYNRLEDVLNLADNERIQVLTHPEWWQDEAMPPYRRVMHCIDGRAERVKAYYESLLRISGRRNIK